MEDAELLARFFGVILIELKCPVVGYSLNVAASAACNSDRARRRVNALEWG
jgi:hypothetical protein